MSAPRNRSAAAPSTDPAYDDRPDYELWERLDTSSSVSYLWMIWRVGPMHGEDAEWFTDEREARARYADLMGVARGGAR